MTDEKMLEALEAMCKCKYDMQIAAHMNNLKDKLKRDIESAQKNNKEENLNSAGETQPSGEHNNDRDVICHECTTDIELGYMQDRGDRYCNRCGRKRS
jgi:molybdenum cofactor biosynthesis enzyme MoaA